MAADVAPRQRLAERRPVVEVRDGAVAGAGIEGARDVPAVRERDERLPLAHRHRVRVRGDGLDGAASGSGPVRAALAREGERCLHLRVPREGLRIGKMDGAPPLVQAVGAGEAPGDALHVAQQERGGVDEKAVAGASGHGEPEQDRGGERVVHGPSLVRVRRRGPVAVVRLDHQDLPAHPLEPHDARSADLAAVETNVVRPDPGGQRVDVQHLFAEAADLEPERSGVVVPVERVEPVEPLEAGRVRLDFGQAAAGLRPGCRCRRGRHRGDRDRPRRPHRGLHLHVRCSSSHPRRPCDRREEKQVRASWRRSTGVRSARRRRPPGCGTPC